MSFRFVAFVWWTATILLALPGFGAGTITGSVKDASGTTLNGVFVSAQRDGVPITTTVYSDDAGRYRFPELTAGTYTVTAQAGGFQPVRRSNVAVKDSTALPMDFTLQVETRPEELLKRSMEVGALAECGVLSFRQPDGNLDIPPALRGLPSHATNLNGISLACNFAAP